MTVNLTVTCDKNDEYYNLRKSTCKGKLLFFQFSKNGSQNVSMIIVATQSYHLGLCISVPFTVICQTLYITIVNFYSAFKFLLEFNDRNKFLTNLLKLQINFWEAPNIRPQIISFTLSFSLKILIILKDDYS